jgi:hypothetical protein
MILPDLGKRIAWYQAHLQPEDTRQGDGIALWTITHEYMSGFDLEARYGARVWGCMGSPASGGMMKLTSEDVAARRAHIVVRVPEKPSDLAQIDRTLIHECGHILVAHLNIPRSDEENIMHSVDNLFSKLTPEEGVALARAIHDPTARAYRAEVGNMPDATEEKKEPDKGAEKPAMAAEGAPRDVATIQGEIAKAALAGAPVDELAKELALALVAAGSAAGNGVPVVEPAAPPVMGMKPEDAYARGQKAGEAVAESKAVKAYAESLEGLTPEQKVEVADAPSMARAQRLVKSYPRQTPIALPPHPAKGKLPEKKLTNGLRGDEAHAMARQMGAKENKPVGPRVLDNGRFSMGHMTPTQLREAIVAGNDPRKQFPSTLGD